MNISQYLHVLPSSLLVALELQDFKNLYSQSGGFVLARSGFTYGLVLGQSSHTTVLVGPLPLVGGVLGQSHVNLGLELISKVTVLLVDKQQVTVARQQLFIIPGTGTNTWSMCPSSLVTQ